MNAAVSIGGLFSWLVDGDMKVGAGVRWAAAIEHRKLLAELLGIIEDSRPVRAHSYTKSLLDNEHSTRRITRSIRNRHTLSREGRVNRLSLPEAKVGVNSAHSEKRVKSAIPLTKARAWLRDHPQLKKNRNSRR